MYHSGVGQLDEIPAYCNLPSWLRAVEQEELCHRITAARATVPSAPISPPPGLDREPCDFTRPYLCDVWPFQHLDWCQPPTEAQIRSCQQFGPAMPPELAEESRTAADVTIEAFKRLHPEEYAGYRRAVDSAGGPINWPLWIGLGLTGVVVVRIISGRR